MVLRLLCSESLDAVSRAVGVEIYRLEAWKARAVAGLELGLKEQAGEPVAAVLDAAKRHIGELSMENELLRERAHGAALWSRAGVSDVGEVALGALRAAGACAVPKAGCWPARRGPTPALSDAQLLAAIRSDLARGLALRMDHGSQYLSDHFLNQVRYWGIHPSFGFLEEPETNGVVERWNRTLKEQAIYGRVFHNLADVRAAVAALVERYNQCWRLEKLAYRTPLEAREQYELRHAA